MLSQNSSDEDFLTSCYEIFLRRQPDPKGFLGHLNRLKAGVGRLDLVAGFVTSEEFKGVRSSKTWVPLGHYFSPLPSETEVSDYAGRSPDPLAISSGIPGIDLNDEAQVALMEEFAGYYASIPFQRYPVEGLRYRYDNESYPAGDGISLHCMLRHLSPKRMIEVGCGNSSCAALDTRDLFLDGNLDLTFIEPYPEFFHSLLSPAEQKEVHLIPSRLQDVDLSEFERLEANDVLFIDSTHVSKLNSDVNHCLFEILPRLKSGVFIHIHDVFFPFEYPIDWLREGRGWNEQYILRAFLQFNKRFRIRYFSTYLFIKHSNWFSQNMPLCLEDPGGSIWLEKVD